MGGYVRDQNRSNAASVGSGCFDACRDHLGGRYQVTELVGRSYSRCRPGFSAAATECLGRAARAGRWGGAREGIWRFCADTGWTDTFLITGGFFSHWQVWIALSIALKLLSSFLLAWAGRTAKIPADD